MQGNQDRNRFALSIEVKKCHMRKKLLKRYEKSIDFTLSSEEVDQQWETVNMQIDLEIQQYHRELVNCWHAAQKTALELESETKSEWWFITAAPRHGISFEKFYETVVNVLKKKHWLSYTVTFEQKGGIDDLPLGHHMHCHIVAQHAEQWKSKVRIDLCNFLTIMDGPGLKYIPAKSPEQIVEKYLKLYESQDDHKIKTFEADKKWREQLGLKDYYKDDLPLKKSCVALTKYNSATIVKFD